MTEDTTQSWQKSRVHNKQRYLVWLKQASFDLAAAKISVDNGFNEWSTFQAGQCLEKLLKGVIVHAGWRPPKIHKLGVLMSMCNRANPQFVDVRLDHHKIESYTYVSRYPFLVPGANESPHEFISSNDALECIEIAQAAVNIVTNFLQNTAKIEFKPFVLEKFTESEVDHRIQSFIDLMSHEFDLQKVILYGSFARNKAQPREKTVDILVVANTKLGFFDRIKKVRDLARGGEPIIEAIVYTPREFKELVDVEGEGFLETAIDEGIVVFEKPSDNIE